MNSPSWIDELPLPLRVPVRALDLSTRPPGLYAVAALFAVGSLLIGVVFASTVTAPIGPDGDFVAGDYLAFYNGAAIVAEGEGSRLYDYDYQHVHEDLLTGRPSTDWQQYLNPPGLAILLAPTTRLGFQGAFVVYDLLGCAILAAGLFATVRTLRISPTRADQAAAAALVLGFQPVARTLLGGQNTAITLGMLALAYGGLRSDSAVLTGVAIGLLSYKPQFGVLFGLLLLIWRRWTAAGLAVAIAAAHYLAGAAIAGWTWPFDWLAVLRIHEPLERAQNGADHFSWPAFVDHTLPALHLLGPIGALAVLGIVAAAAFRVDPASKHFPAAFGLAILGTMLASPHLQYYDVGLMALPALLLVEQRAPLSLPWRAVLVAGFFGTEVWKLGDVIGAQPLFFVLLGAFVLSALASGAAPPGSAADRPSSEPHPAPE